MIEHGRVLTASGWSDAVAVRDRQIVAFGADARAMTALHRFDAGGRLVIRGIRDQHVHEPVLFDAHDVAGSETDDAATTLANIERATREVPRGTWLHGVLDVDADLTQGALDRVAPEHPVWLDNATGHVVVLSSLAERTLRLSPSPPRGGFIDKPGWRSEYARYEAMRARGASVSDEAIAHALREFELEALRFGITAVTAFPLDVDADVVFDTLRIYGHKLQWTIISTPIGEIDVPRKRFQRSHGLLLFGTKYFIDGMQVERGAALRQPYSDTSSRGRLDWSRDEIHRLLEITRSTQGELHLHVVGDRAIDTVFDEMEALGGTWPEVVLEHAHLVDVARAKRLGVRIVTNPFHSAMAELNRARLGDRVSRWMPLRDLLAAHVPLAFGSDGPLNPFYNIALATKHPTNPAQAIDRDTALALYSPPLDIGTSADIAVLTGAVDDPKTRSILTIVAGEVELDLTRASATTSARTE